MDDDGEAGCRKGDGRRLVVRVCVDVYTVIYVRNPVFAGIHAIRRFRARCCYGIDMATRAELIGADFTEQEICDFVGADSLHYITLDGLISATPNERENLCTACFTGEYPIPVPGEHEQLAQVKFDFEALAGSPDAV